MYVAIGNVHASGTPALRVYLLRNIVLRRAALVPDALP